MTGEPSGDAKALKANQRAQVRDAVETRLRRAPRKTGRGGIKRFAGCVSRGIASMSGDIRLQRRIGIARKSARAGKVTRIEDVGW